MCEQENTLRLETLFPQTHFDYKRPGVEFDLVLIWIKCCKEQLPDGDGDCFKGLHL